MDDIVYKTTYSEEEVVKKKEVYLERKHSLTERLYELAKMLEAVGEAPFSGKPREEFMMKFDTVDRRLLDRFDIASLEYFEAREAPEKG